MTSSDGKETTPEALARRYEAILNAAAEGIYGLDRDGRVTFVNAAARRLTGWTRRQQLGRRQHELLHHSHEDGSPYPESACPIYCTLRDGRTRRGEEVFWCNDGTRLPVAFTSAALRDEQGMVAGAVVTFSDRSTQTLQRRYRALVAATSDFVWRCDAEGAVEDIDNEWLELTGLSRAGALGWGWVAALHPDDRAAYRRTRASAIQAGQSFAREYRLRCADGRDRWFLNHMVPVTDTAGRLVEWVGTGREITARKLREQALEDQAAHDPLTGLPNRRQFQMLLEHEMRRAQRDAGRFCVVMFDVDRFKAVNDRYGHEAGDAVLKQLAAVVPGTIRSSDVLARWGGEEFVILLPGSELTGAQRVAEAVRGRIAEERFPGPGRVTISAGVTEYRGGEEAASPLMRRADKALYQAKNSGRNRVAVNAPPPG